jgi:antidote-toxin recognition MazE-like antitoxin
MRTVKRSRTREKVRAHRERLRRRGLRPVQIWLPDTRSETFRREAHRQSLVIAKDPQEPEDQAFVEALADWPPE